MRYACGWILKARDLLTDVEQTAFFFVTLPEALPIAVIKRFINWFHDFGIPVGGVIVNMVIQKDQVRPDSPEFVRNRVAMQDGYMQEIWRDFDNVRAVVPLLDNEVRGTESLQGVARYVFPAKQEISSPMDALRWLRTFLYPGWRPTTDANLGHQTGSNTTK